MRYADDPKAYNAAVARLAQRLKRDVGAENVAQNYKGTGSQAHRRQLWVRYPNPTGRGVDVWLDSGFAQIGGVMATPAGVTQRRLVYGEQTPEEVYAWMVGQLRQTQAAAPSLSGIGGHVAGMFGDVDPIVATFKALQVGDRVRVTMAPQGTSPAKSREVTITLLRTSTSGTPVAYTTSGRTMPGNGPRGGVIELRQGADYRGGPDRGERVYFQPTINQQVQRVIGLEVLGMVNGLGRWRY
jgi:hypothetical protein